MRDCFVVSMPVLSLTPHPAFWVPANRGCTKSTPAFVADITTCSVRGRQRLKRFSFSPLHSNTIYYGQGDEVALCISITEERADKQENE